MSNLIFISTEFHYNIQLKDVGENVRWLSKFLKAQIRIYIIFLWHLLEMNFMMKFCEHFSFSHFY